MPFIWCFKMGIQKWVPYSGNEVPTINHSKTHVQWSLLLASAILGISGLIELSLLAQAPYRLGYDEGVAFSGRQTFIVAALSAGVAFGFLALTVCKNGASGILMKVGATASVCLSVAGLAIWAIRPGNMAVHSIQSSLNMCLNNIRTTEGAKAKWAIRIGATNGTAIAWNDIAPDFPK